MDRPRPSFLARHEFAIRRLHSLSGLIPVGAYMVLHLVTNASVLESPAAFQLNVYRIDSLGKLLLPVEWTFIFIPFLFHAIIGVMIIFGGLPNTTSYPYSGNVRYALQRATGMIAFVFIMFHVFHMHGWIHTDWWLQRIAHPMGGAQFKPYNAASSAGLAMQSALVMGVYTVGVLACVYHLANGLWTMGITWGVWTSPRAQRRAGWVCNIAGVGLAVVGLSALGGMWRVGHGPALQEARKAEDRVYENKKESGEIQADPHKRSHSQDTERLTRQRQEADSL